MADEHSSFPLAIVALRDLRERLSNASETLANMPVSTINTVERARLDGKAEGVRLALSYVDEALREMW